MQQLVGKGRRTLVIDTESVNTFLMFARNIELKWTKSSAQRLGDGQACSFIIPEGPENVPMTRQAKENREGKAVGNGLHSCATQNRNEHLMESARSNYGWSIMRSKREAIWKAKVTFPGARISSSSYHRDQLEYSSRAFSDLGEYWHDVEAFSSRPSPPTCSDRPWPTWSENTFVSSLNNVNQLNFPVEK